MVAACRPAHDVADVEADKFSKPKTGAEGQAEDYVVPYVAGACFQSDSNLTLGKGGLRWGM